MLNTFTKKIFVIMSTYPDLEVYIYNLPTDAIVSWLDRHFEDVRVVKKSGSRSYLSVDGMEVMLLEKAAGSKYLSLWFKHNRTPWSTDLALAKTIAQDLNACVRCSSGGWTESEDKQALTANDWVEVKPDKTTQQVHWAQ
jgi:hypothetical protein